MVEITHANSSGLGFAALSNIIGGAGQGVESYQQAQARKQQGRAQEQQMRLQEKEAELRMKLLEAKIGEIGAQGAHERGSKAAAGDFLGRLAEGDQQAGKNQQALGDLGQWMAYRAAGAPKAMPGSIMDLKPGKDYTDPFGDPVMAQLFMETHGEDRDALVGILNQRRERAMLESATERFSSRLQAAVAEGMLPEDQATTLAMLAQDDPARAFELFDQGLQEAGQEQARAASIMALSQQAQAVIQGYVQTGQAVPNELSGAMFMIQNAASDPKTSLQDIRKLWTAAQTRVEDRLYDSGATPPAPVFGAQPAPDTSAAGLDMEGAPSELQQLLGAGSALSAARPDGVPNPEKEEAPRPPAPPSERTDGSNDAERDRFYHPEDSDEERRMRANARKHGRSG